MTIRIACTLLVLVLFVTTGSGLPLHPIEIGALTEKADLIVLGEVMSRVREGTTTIDMSGTLMSAEIVRAEIAVDRALKGTAPTGVISLSFAMPDRPVGYRDVVQGEYRMFFLQRKDDSLSFADPWYGDLPAIREQNPVSGSPLNQVTMVLGRALESTRLSDVEQFEVLDAVRRLHTDLSTEILRQTLQSASGDFKLEVARSLVARNDLAAFAVVKDALLQQTGLPVRLVLDLAGSLNGLSDPRAVPGLAKLTEINDSAIRRPAAEALRRTGSQSAIEPLSKLLGDSEFRVRYSAVVGLGEITHQDEWTPTINEFERNEERYLKHWRLWVDATYK